jgi:hypothetical protein
MMLKGDQRTSRPGSSRRTVKGADLHGAVTDRAGDKVVWATWAAQMSITVRSG